MSPAQPVLRLLLLVTAVALMPLLGRPAGADAQAPPNFAFVVFEPGWNIVAFGGSTNLDSPGLRSVIDAPLYTFQPGDSGFEETDLAHVAPGTAYWVHFAQDSFFFLPRSTIDSYSVDVAAGSCVLVGNPSTSGSARVEGADRLYAFSPALNSYTGGSLIGVGRGAWACNGAQGSTVTVRYQGDMDPLEWPACCGPAATGNSGRAHVIFKNDSSAPVLVGLAQMDGSSEPMAGGGVAGAHLGACRSCPAYSAHDTCNPQAVSYSVDLEPGVYALHVQSHAPDVPDTISTITLSADTSYVFCYYNQAGYG
jgi:hypothetical protein